MKNSKKQQLQKKVMQWKKLTKQIIYLSIMCLFGACGSTRVAVQKPAEGTSTTITVTTNNPITTNVDPNTNVQFTPLKTD